MLDNSYKDQYMLLGNRKNTIVWPKDASNGLSFERMKHQVKLNHPRKMIEKERKVFPIFTTHTGWYCILKSWRKSDVR